MAPEKKYSEGEVAILDRLTVMETKQVDIIEDIKKIDKDNEKMWDIILTHTKNIVELRGNAKVAKGAMLLVIPAILALITGFIIKLS